MLVYASAERGLRDHSAKELSTWNAASGVRSCVTPGGRPATNRCRVEEMVIMPDVQTYLQKHEGVEPHRKNNAAHTHK